VARPGKSRLGGGPEKRARTRRTARASSTPRRASSPGTASARAGRSHRCAGRRNKRMLYYYFGDKDGLFRAVLEHAYARIRAAEQALRLLDVPPADACGGSSSSPGTTTSRTRSSSRSSTARTCIAGSTCGAPAHQHDEFPVIATLAEILKRGADAGEFRRASIRCSLCVHRGACLLLSLEQPHAVAVLAGTSPRPRPGPSGSPT